MICQRVFSIIMYIRHKNVDFLSRLNRRSYMELALNYGKENCKVYTLVLRDEFM